MHIIGDVMGIPETDRAEVFHLTDVIMAAPDPASGISAVEHLKAGMDLYEYAQASSARRSGATRPMTCGAS